MKTLFKKLKVKSQKSNGVVTLNSFQGLQNLMCRMLQPASTAKQGEQVQHVTSSIIILLLFIVPTYSYSQVYSDKDVKICNSKFELAVEKNLSDKPIGDVISEVGKSFLGTNYEAFAIEKEGEEQLVINLTGLDCTTFLENALVFSRLIKKEKTTFDDYKDELTFIRYRDGELNQYPSRLHYFSDWIYNNRQKGIIEDITKEIGGEPITFEIDFMSTHPVSYLHLKLNPDFISVIAEQEKEISDRTYYYIPQEKISSIENQIRNGDLIAFTTNLKGLDISHVGIAVKEKNGRIHLLHSPQVGSKVQITEKPIGEYVKSVKKHTGIIVLRAYEPL